jgi:uncharacterized protein involved in exopolysaccharide biosynthesis
MSRHNNQAKALLEAWDVLLRHRRRFIVPAFVVTAGVLAASMLLPRKYRAEAVFERRTDMVLTEIMHRGASDSFQDPKQSLEKELSGEPAMRDLFDKLRVSEDPDVRQAVLDMDMEDFDSQIARKTTVSYDIATNQLDRIRVSLIHQNARLAQAVVNTMIASHIERTHDQIESRLQETAGFFQSEVDRARSVLEHLEDQKLEFEIQHGRMLPEQRDGILMLLADIQSQLTGLEQEREGAIVRVQELRKLLESTPKTLPEIVTRPNPEIDRLQKKAQQLRDQIDVYQQTYKMTHEHPDLVQLENQIESLNAEIANTPTEVASNTQLKPNQQYQEVENQLANANTDVLSLERRIAGFREEIVRINLQSSDLLPVRSEYRKLARGTDDAQRDIAFWEDNLRRVQIAKTAESGDRGIKMDFIQPCSMIRKPVSPNLAQVVMAAMALGLISGGLNVFFAHRIDETYYSGGELAESLSLPLFGSVSEIISKKEQASRRMRKLIVYPINAVAMMAVLGTMFGLLYLNLQKPQQYAEFKAAPTHFIIQNLFHEDLTK